MFFHIHSMHLYNLESVAVTKLTTALISYGFCPKLTNSQCCDFLFEESPLVCTHVVCTYINLNTTYISNLSIRGSFATSKKILKINLFMIFCFREKYNTLIFSILACGYICCGRSSMLLYAFCAGRHSKNCKFLLCCQSYNHYSTLMSDSILPDPSSVTLTGAPPRPFYCR